jgi:hypothetical protein
VAMVNGCGPCISVDTQHESEGMTMAGVSTYVEQLCEHCRREGYCKYERESSIPSPDLLDAAQLLDDCLIRIYPEEFTKEHQEAAAKRFWEHNGTISRIADMADKLRRASNAPHHASGCS